MEVDCCTAFFKVEIGSCVAAAAYIMDDAGLDGVNTAAGAVKAANATADSKVVLRGCSGSVGRCYGKTATSM